MFSLIGKVFNTLIAQPIFNLLVLIIALLPGHNLGAAIIIFTILVRVCLYPLLRKQLHHAMAMKKLQPEMKRIKKEAKGNKQLEAQLMSALYKEKEINPFGSIGIILVQLPILISLYLAISKIVKDPGTIVTNAYGWVQNLPFIEQLAAKSTQLNETFLGIDLTKTAVAQAGVYWPAMVLVVGSVIVQYYQSKQLMMTDKKQRSLLQILKDTTAGKEVDQSEVQAATNKFTLYIIPFFLFIVAIKLAAALSLYWLIGGLVAIWQQRRILNQDVQEMEAVVDNEPVKAEIVTAKTSKKAPSKKKAKKTKKRR